MCVPIISMIVYKCLDRLNRSYLQSMFFASCHEAMADPAVRTLYSKYVNAYTIHEETGVFFFRGNPWKNQTFGGKPWGKNW